MGKIQLKLCPKFLNLYAGIYGYYFNVNQMLEEELCHHQKKHLQQLRSVRLSAPCAIFYLNHQNVLPPQSRLANVAVVNLARVKAFLLYLSTIMQILY
jgi:hypothetical protein